MALTKVTGAGVEGVTISSTTDVSDQFILTNTNTGSSSGPDLVLFRQSTSSAADSDGIGRIDFRGLNDANEEINYATIYSKISDASDGTEDGEFYIQQISGGSYVTTLKIDGDGRTQINANKATGFACEIFNDGNNSNRYGLHLQCGTDNASGTNYAITFYDGDVTSQGNITFTSGTVTYGAFTAHHEISLPDADKSSGYPYGTLLETTAIYYTQKDGSDTERGIRYLTQKSSSQYSRKILGTYCGDLLAVADSSGTYANNLHQAAVLGDGHILCNNSGGNIKVGDGICASATAGIGQKADKLCMIIGIAQKDITFSGSETVLVPVQYGLQQFTPWTD